jgi:hypothetical protein
MNERIQKLAEQATTRVDAVLNESMAYTYFDTEKFAELIVKECLVVINQSNGVGDDDVIKISQDVKKHFGVEE